MASPKISGGKPVKIHIWDDTNKQWVAWDGVLTTGDIEIGAVEIKNAADDTRAKVKSDGTDNALVVTQNSQPLPTGAATQTTLALIKTNTDNLTSDPSTETKQDSLLAELQLKADLTETQPVEEQSPIDDNYPAGSGVNGSVTLTLADTAYAVPATASTEKHILILYNSTAYDMYWGYQNTNANGILLPAGGRAILDLGASQQVYAYCATAAQAITYSYKEVE